MLLILVQNAANAFKAATIPKLYIPSIINTEQVFGQIKNGLVSGRLACKEVFETKRTTLVYCLYNESKCDIL